MRFVHGKREVDYYASSICKQLAVVNCAWCKIACEVVDVQTASLMQSINRYDIFSFIAIATPISIDLVISIVT